MKKQFVLLFASFLTFSFLFTSCTEDDPLGTGPGLSPSIRLVSASGFISQSVDAEAGSTLAFRVTASAGDDPLTLLTIRENGSNVELSRITFETGSNFVANPASILDATEQQGFTQDILIAAPTTPGSYQYQFEVRDQAGIVSNTAVTVSIELTPPILSILAPTSPTEAGSGSTITVSIDALQGTAALATIAVYENDTLMNANRLAFDNNGITPFLGNPEFTPSIQSFQTDLAIEVSDVADSTTVAYRIELADSEGLTSSATLEVLVVNSIDTSYTGVLVFNRDGQQFGGLNLYTGQAVAFNSPDAQIRDLGIDLNVPVASNWLRRIRAINGASLKIPGDMQAEGFSFANTNTRDALITAYDNGVDIGDSDQVMIGDIFLVRNNSDYFILEVTDVVETPNDNNDFYEFSIKKSCE